jgi:predicted ATPase
MIKEIAIKNFKSIVDLKLPLGKFNLFIGANGSGKSSILEAIAFGAAASAGKLDYEYFANRGIRVVEPRFMLPAFSGVESERVFVSVTDEQDDTSAYSIHYNNEAKPARWEDDSISLMQIVAYLNKKTTEDNATVNDLIEVIKQMESERGSDTTVNVRIESTDKGMKIMPIINDIDRFLIYSLEETKLRKADDSNKTYPLGLHGEGLFAYLKQVAQRPDSVEIFNEIKENLKVLDWFDDMQVPSEQLSNEFNLKLKDSYLADTINTFDQRSTNEGFLYLLFYLTLIISDETPTFFAIENIDTAFNPKLCREVTKRLIELARKHDKQIIATTHNASVLDGMNLNEDDVYLHVVRRSIDGYTKTNRVVLKQELGMSLSEAWQKGFLGGLPDNF